MPELFILVRWMISIWFELVSASRLGLERLARRLRRMRLWVILPGSEAARSAHNVLPFHLADLLRLRAQDAGLRPDELLIGLLRAGIRSDRPLDLVELVWKQLTEREREIAVLMAQGLSNRAIASRLMISRNTVRSHAGRVLRKFDCRSRLELPAALKDKRVGPG